MNAVAGSRPCKARWLSGCKRETPVTEGCPSEVGSEHPKGGCKHQPGSAGKKGCISA